jgi:hypothetical protein
VPTLGGAQKRTEIAFIADLAERAQGRDRRSPTALIHRVAKRAPRVAVRQACERSGSRSI